METKYPCPCCGHATLPHPPTDTFCTCPTCGWEDDGVQFDDIYFEGGANNESLAEARQNFLRYGTSSRPRRDDNAPERCVL